VVITSVGGTLGLTSPYGVGDPTITRRRVEADLAVFREYQMKYRGMLEACKQQLDWTVERYARLPQPPELLVLEYVPSFWIGLAKGLGVAVGWFVGSFIAGMALFIVCMILFIFVEAPIHWEKRFDFIAKSIMFGGSLVCVLLGPLKHFRVKLANGNKPWENARRQQAYEEAVAAALKAAEPIKAAEDHRQRCQIRDLEGLIKTVGEKEAGVRRILATL